MSLFCALCTLLTQSIAQAHFPWLVREEDGQVSYFFGEGLTDRQYKLPPSLAATEVFQLSPAKPRTQLEMRPMEQEKFVGLRSAQPVPADAHLCSQATFGIYHGSRLDYYTHHLAGALPTSRETYHSLPSGLDLSAELLDTETGVDVYVSWKGKPLPEIEVHLYSSDGEESATASTDDSGKVSFSDEQVQVGLNAIMLGHKVKQAGKFKDAAYETQAHYLTATFSAPATAATAAPASEPAAAKLPSLPLELTSFGAARQGSAIYVYGGHTGEAHSYSTNAQNDKLMKLDLAHPQQGWQTIAQGERLQGLGMVAHGERLIVVGGFTAKNAEGEKHDLHSQSQVRVFDLSTQRWSQLPALPEPRSSHDAALIGDTIYVVGGWQLQGHEDSVWHTTAWSMDLSAAKPEWSQLPTPPFARRALATVAHQGQLFVIGGMNENGGPTKAVVVFDPVQKTWNEVAELPGKEAMAGFGASGWSSGGSLIITTYEGAIVKWRDADRSWEHVGETADARFFHRMLPIHEHQLVSVGGANMGEGKYAELELVPVR
jgi:N-acetylneuraminic acid mutarotase